MLGKSFDPCGFSFKKGITGKNYFSGLGFSGCIFRGAFVDRR